MATQHDTSAAEGSIPLPRRRRKPVTLSEGLRVRLSVEERRALAARAAAAGVTVSHYARRLLTAMPEAPAPANDSPAPTPASSPIVELVYQLRRVGTNHNQLARLLNSGQLGHGSQVPVSLAQIDDQLKRIERVVFTLICET